MHRPESATASPPLAVDAPAFLRMEAVSKVYRMGATQVHALREVELSLPAGRFTAVVGRSGSGKSTLLHLLAAMDAPTSGEIAVGAWRLSTLGRKAQARYRREMVGMIFQQFNLIPSMTALQNVEMPLLLGGTPPETRRRRARASLEQVGLTHRLDHRPTELSGGEQQRVAIARALVHDPPVLLADEPTGNLDSDTGRQILRHLAEIHRTQGKTVILVTHQLPEVEAFAEQVVCLHDGRVVASD